jgi:hypothetical protein
MKSAWHALTLDATAAVEESANVPLNGAHSNKLMPHKVRVV